MIDDVIIRYEKEMKKKELAVHLKKHPQYVAMYATKGMLQMDYLIQNPDQQDLGKQAQCTLEMALRLHDDYQDAPSDLLKIEIMCHLARVHCEMKNFAKAKKTFEMADELISKSVGRNHPLTATVLASWSRVFHDTSFVKEAISMLEDAWEIRNGFLSSELHPNPLLYAYFLTQYYKDIGNSEKALHWCNVTINGYAYLISKEDLRVRNLDAPHIIFKNGRLPVCDSWQQRLDDCRKSYNKLMYL